MDRPEEIGGLGQILAGELEEELFAGETGRGLGMDRVVVGAALDGLIEDRGIAGEAGDRKLFDVIPKGAVLQQLPGDVVEPEALAQVMESFGGVHGYLLPPAAAVAAPSSVGMSYSSRSPIRPTLRSAGG